MLSNYGKYSPVVDKTAYVDDLAKVIGRVIISKNCAVFPGAVLRADDDDVVIEEGAVVLDNVVIEAPKGFPVIVGKGSIISHGAIVHGAHVGERAVVGIGAIMLEGSRLGCGSILGAGALLMNGKHVGENKVALGIPAEVKRAAKPEDADKLAREHAALLKKAKVYISKK